MTASLEFDRSGKWIDEKPLEYGNTIKVSHIGIYVQNDHCVDWMIRMGYTHESLEILFVDGDQERRMTVDLMEDGVVRRWGHYRQKKVYKEKQIFYYYDEIVDKTPNQKYSLFFNNCRTFSRRVYNDL